MAGIQRFVTYIYAYENKEKSEIIKEKNRITEQIRQKLATAFAIKEEQIIIYEKGE